MSLGARVPVKRRRSPLAALVPGLDRGAIREVLTREKTRPVLTRTAAFASLAGLGAVWIPFYPAWMAVFLAVVLGGISLRFPVLSLILLSVLVSAAAAFQRAEFGLLMLVLSLFLSVAALFDWKFTFLVLLSLFLSRAGLAFLPPMMAAMLFPAFLAVSAMAVSGVILTILTTCGNSQVLGYFVASPHASSFLVFTEPGHPVFAPQDIGGALLRIPQADPEVMAAVMGQNLGASLLPYLQVVLWAVAVWIVALLARRKGTLKDWTLVTAVGSGILLAGFYASAGAAGLVLGPLGVVLPLTIVLAVGGGVAASYEVQERFRDYLIAREGIQHVGTRLSDAPELRQATFQSVGGLSDVKSDLRESIMVPLLHTKAAEIYRITPSRGILLFGPPGCGKTLLMTALAGELKVEMFTIKASDIMSKWYGESEGKIDQLFRVAKERRPSIIFIDDIDAIAKSRDLYAGDDVTPRLLGMILAEIDGMDKVGGMIMVGTTNKPDLVDPALLRPGRFDKIIYVPPPSFAERKEILKVHLRGRPARGLNLEAIGKRAERFSGADLANLVTEAARLAMKRSLQSGKPDPIVHADFEAVLARMKPSITLAMADTYRRLQLAYERKMHEVERVGVERGVEVAGMDGVRGELTSYLDLAFHKPERMEEFHLQPSRGLLLFGPPGCGKTLLLRRAAQDLRITLHAVSAPSLLTSADASAEIKEIFYLARENTPSLVVVESVDLLAGKDERSPAARTLLSQLLSLMDSVGPRERIMVGATTNRPHVLDDALFGVGRFDKMFYVPPPDAESRRLLLESRLRHVPSDRITAEFLKEIAARTDGHSSADLVAVVDEAKLLAINEDAPLLFPEHLQQALGRVKPSVTLESVTWSREFAQRRNVRG